MGTLLDYLAGRAELYQFLSFLVAIVIAITIHEFAHAKAAQMAGDPTPGQAGRVTLNPLAHFDPIGTVMIILAGFGWGKPVPVNHLFFKRPRVDNILVSFWGPLSNIITAILVSIPLRLGVVGEYDVVLIPLVLMNLVLAFFNLIPVYPLDGSHILVGLLPLRQAQKVSEFYARFGMIMLILLIMTGATDILVGRPVWFMFRLLTGL